MAKKLVKHCKKHRTATSPMPIIEYLLCLSQIIYASLHIIYLIVKTIVLSL